MISVAVYGTNLVMSSLCAGLQERPGLDVRGIQNLPCDGIRTPGVSLPDVILFDLATCRPDFVIPLLQESPATLLVGVDLTSHKMLVLSGEQSHLLTADDLLRVVGQTRGNVKQIDGKLNNSMPIMKG